MKKHIHTIIFILFFILFSLQGCIKENRDNCESALLLRFSYTLNEDYRDRFGEDVDKITVYVFDNNHKFVGIFSEYTANLKNNTMSIPLPQGDYDVVAYGGDLSTYRIDNAANTDDFRLTLKNTTGGNGELLPVKAPNDLYAGYMKKAVSTACKCEISAVELIRDTKKITVEVHSNDFASPLDVYLKSANGKYTFENNRDDDYGIYKYTPSKVTTNGNTTFADLKTMRLVIGTPVELSVFDPTSSALIYKEDLIALILEHPAYSSQVDLDREDEFKITIYIKKSTNEITVSVNGWVINDIAPTMI